MSKALIVLIVTIIVLGTGITLFFMKKSADVAKETSNKIMNDFKAVDESLQQSINSDSIKEKNIVKDSLVKLKDSLLKELNLTEKKLKEIRKEQSILRRTAGPLRSK